MSVGQWISRTNAARMLVKAGRFGGTYANKDIAFYFEIWTSSKYHWYYSNRLLILL
ncbi:MAG: KilA-N domain-containing protein [Saprospiraceae bacterium]|nr:KilA-N domain-containing protein [Saprospiraceae bacterium]